MAKQRLVDFRGGINQKISPHMIGDSQGQSAQDVDLSAVRLQGRNRIYTAEDKALGEFFYDAGNRWVSTNSTTDGSSGNNTYIQDASDFAVWNRDLYVARNGNPTTGNGTLIRYNDGAISAQDITILPPPSAVVSPSYPFQGVVSSWLPGGEGGSGATLVNPTAGQAAQPAGETTSLSVTTTLIVNGSGLKAAIAGSSNQNAALYLASYVSQPTNFSLVTTDSTTPIYYWGRSPARTSAGTNYEIYTQNNNWTGGPNSTSISASRTSAAYGVSAGQQVFSNQGFGAYYAPISVVFYNNIVVYSSSTGSTRYWVALLPYTAGFYWDNFSSYNTAAQTSGNISWYPENISATFEIHEVTSQEVTTTTSAQPYIPPTPRFTSDDARLYIYRQFTSADTDASTWDQDPAQGSTNSPWLDQNLDLTSSTDDGYYLSIIEASGGSAGSWTGLPTESQGKTKASLAANTSYITDTDALRKPQRLDFTSVAAPSGDTTVTQSYGDSVACYKLYRVDSSSTTSSPVSLGYIQPNNSYSFSISGTSVSIANLNSSSDYRLYWKAYQLTTISVTVNSGTPVTSKSPGSLGTDGVEFSGSDTLQITLNTGTDGFEGVDFWLEEKIIDNGGTSDTYAVVKCFDYFAYPTSNESYNNSDFLDAFRLGLGSSADAGATDTAPPDFLKFLRESNNFFFAVGTSNTTPERYGGNASTPGSGIGNKADSFLFVSTYNNPRDWPYEGYVQFEDSITGIESYSGELIAWTKLGTYRVTGSRANQMRKQKLASTEGLPAAHVKSVAQVGQYLVWVSQSGICFYNGNNVTNLTRGRFPKWTFTGNLKAGQLNDKYYVFNSATETGYSVDFSLEGFPVTEIDFKEGGSSTTDNLLHYVPSQNRLYTRTGRVDESDTRNLFSYQTRGFDGGAFGSLKLVKSVTVNGTGSGDLQVYLDGKPVYANETSPLVYRTGNYQTFVKQIDEDNSWVGGLYRYYLYWNGTLIREYYKLYELGTDTNLPSRNSLYDFYSYTHTDGYTYEWKDLNDSEYRAAFYDDPVDSVNDISWYYIRRTGPSKHVEIDSSFGTDEPARIYLPAGRTNNPYGLSVADVWSVEISNWGGQIDWIETDYEVLST